MSLFKPKNLTPGLNSDVTVLERGVTGNIPNQYMGTDTNDTELEFSCIVDGDEEVTSAAVGASVDMKVSSCRTEDGYGYEIVTRQPYNSNSIFDWSVVNNVSEFSSGIVSFGSNSDTIPHYPLQTYATNVSNTYKAVFNICTFGGLSCSSITTSNDMRSDSNGINVLPSVCEIRGFIIKKHSGNHSVPHMGGKEESVLDAVPLKDLDTFQITLYSNNVTGIKFSQGVTVPIKITRIGYTQIQWKLDCNATPEIQEFMKIFLWRSLRRSYTFNEVLQNLPILFIGKPASNIFDNIPNFETLATNKGYSAYWLNEYCKVAGGREYLLSGNSIYDKQISVYSEEGFWGSQNINMYPISDNGYNQITIPLSLTNVSDNIPTTAGAFFRGAPEGDEYKFNYHITLNGKYGSKVTSNRESFYLITNTPTFSWELWNDLGYYYIHINEDNTGGQIEKWRYKYYISSEELVAGQTSLENKILKHTSEWKQGAPYNNYVFTDIQTAEPSIKYISIELELVFKNGLTKIVPLSNNGKDFIGMTAREMSDFTIDLTEMPEMGGMYIEVNTDNPSKFVSKRYNKLTNEYEDYMKPLHLQRVEIINGERVITDLTYNLIYGHNGFTRDDRIVIAPELAVPIIDYGIKSNVPFFYRIIAESAEYQSDIFQFNSIPYYQETDIQKMEFDKWIMYLTKDKSSNFVGFYEFHQDYGPYRNIEMPYQSVDKILYFDLNINSGSITNNNQVTIVKNFTPYPTVQKAPSYYWSGTLKSLLGYIALNNIDYIQTPTMLKDYKELSSTEYKKFLKDKDGNLWQIEINGAVQIENNDKLADIQLKTKSVPWVEVADASRTSLIQIAGDNQEFVLQGAQYSNPLIKYAWFDEKYWDDNLIWSESDIQ